MLVTVWLQCFSADSVEAVVDEHKDYFGAGADNTVRQEGDRVAIKYFDARWPLDVAGWAAEQGHASDASVAHVIASL